MTQISILIVEDEAIVAADLASRVRQLGYDVAGTTAFGEEAVELARGLRPALVLMDIRLAGAMDGIAAAKEIHRECNLPVLFLTAHSDAATVERARQAEAFGYILKPFDERDLRIQIEMALYKHAAERRLFESEERLRLLGDNLPDSAVYQYVQDTDGSARFTYVSEGIESLNGISVQEVLRDAGALHRQILPQYHARFFKTKALSASDLSDFNIEVPMLRPDGVLRWMQLHSRPRRMPDGRVVWDGVQTDITDRKRSEEALQERQQALEQSRAGLQAANSKLVDSRRAALNMMEDAIVARRQAEKAILELQREVTERERVEEELRGAKQVAESATQAKSQFLANMSHELRTPMTGVLGMLDLVLLGSLDAEQREFIEISKRSALALVKILNDILDLTRIEAGQLSIEEKPFSVRDCVASTCDILFPAVKGKGIDLDCTVADDVPDTLIGDQHRISQVLTNLAGNAVKFTPKGKIELCVTDVGSTLESKREITFTVRDSGIGIPGDKKNLLFRAFSQTDDSHSRSYGGAGLGLVISKEIVERMGGTITFTSEEGLGSTFTFTLPLAEAPRENDAQSATKPQSTETTPIPAGERIPRLLLAEDDPTISKILGLMLERSHYEIDIAQDGQQAIEMWEQGGYDLVLMDVQMPRLNGFEATRVIRNKEQERGGHTPIVAMTAHAGKEAEEKCLAAGMDAYIAKPVNFDETLQVVGEILKNVSRIQW